MVRRGWLMIFRLRCMVWLWFMIFWFRRVVWLGLGCYIVWLRLRCMIWLGFGCYVMWLWWMHNRMMVSMMMFRMHHVSILFHIVFVHRKSKDHFQAEWMSMHVFFVIIVISFISFVRWVVAFGFGGMI